MTSDELKQWRTDMCWSQRRAAKELGVALVTYQTMERGARFGTGESVAIDTRTRLACQYLKDNNKFAK